ncbi:MAG: thioredoxin domain-containing protein, partial [Desulfovibrionales bacterium]
MKRIFVLVSVFLLSLVTSCAPKQDISKDQVEAVLRENPQIIFAVLQDNKDELVAVVEQGIQERKKAEQRKGLEKALENPLQPEIDLDRPYLGPADAPITIVEYSDFFCPYCSRGSETAEQIVAAHPNEVRLLYKHLPLKPLSKTAAFYFEAIGEQDGNLAWAFADRIYANQRTVLEQGEPALKQIASELEVDMERLLKDV